MNERDFTDLRDFYIVLQQLGQTQYAVNSHKKKRRICSSFRVWISSPQGSCLADVAINPLSLHQDVAQDISSNLLDISELRLILIISIIHSSLSHCKIIQRKFFCKRDLIERTFLRPKAVRLGNILYRHSSELKRSILLAVENSTTHNVRN